MKTILVCLLIMNFIALFAQNTSKIYMVDEKVKTKASLTPKLYTHPYGLKLNLSEYNYIAIFNKSPMSYNFYPTKCNLNFGLNSPRVADRSLSSIKVDSFNPF